MTPPASARARMAEGKSVPAWCAARPASRARSRPGAIAGPETHPRWPDRRQEAGLCRAEQHRHRLIGRAGIFQRIVPAGAEGGGLRPQLRLGPRTRLNHHDQTRHQPPEQRASTGRVVGPQSRGIDPGGLGERGQRIGGRGRVVGAACGGWGRSGGRAAAPDAGDRPSGSRTGSLGCPSRPAPSPPHCPPRSVPTGRRATRMRAGRARRSTRARRAAGAGSPLPRSIRRAAARRRRRAASRPKRAAQPGWAASPIRRRPDGRRGARGSGRPGAARPSRRVPKAVSAPSPIHRSRPQASGRGPIRRRLAQRGERVWGPHRPTHATPARPGPARQAGPYRPVPSVAPR